MTHDEYEAAFDQWVASLGGYASRRFRAVHDEARQFGGAGGYAGYLDMCKGLDEKHAAGAGKWLAAEIELANAREARRRGEEAAAAALARSTEIRLAAEQLLADPRLAEPDLSTRAPMGRAEIDLELRAALGLANRAPTAYEAMLPPVGDLARTIGLRA
jgi:hypothetical protein